MRLNPSSAVANTLALLVMATCFALTARAEDAITPEQSKFFESKIRPVLIKECYSCHSTQAGSAKGGLRLDTAQLSQLGGNSGPAIVPHDVDASLLFNAIDYQDFAMPPKGKLADSVIADFRQWIEMGAPDPRQTEVSKTNSTISDDDIKRAKQDFWAYQPPKPVSAPEVSDAGWAKSGIDRFVFAKLGEASMMPAPDADPVIILKRLSYDLIGLPPTPGQIETFKKAWAKNPDDAVRVTVDKLLDSHLFGERWGRHWLDLVRYAESNGREVNQTFPHAWRYRDYVIDSFNEDKPYDDFVREQLAGDLIPAKDDADWAEHLIATGFLALGPKSLSEQKGAQFVMDLADEQIDVTTRVLLGTSVACARCHDHKFDPISQSDYYAMAGIFVSTATYYGAPASELGLRGSIQNRNLSNLIRLPVEDPNPFDKTYSREEITRIEDEIRNTQREQAEAMMARSENGGQNQIMNLIRNRAKIEALSTVLGGIDANGNPISFCMGVQDREQPRDTPLLARGEIDQPADPVRRGVPRVLANQSLHIPSGSSGRLQMAQWITSDSHPLTSRVMVNRIWQHLVGTGIVRTTEDFGFTGETPTHPELLDFLANRFVESGWSIKTLIRDITSSRLYRMTSDMNDTNFQKDPENKLYWRANKRRMAAESIRDSMLFVSGELDTKRPRASEVAKAGYMQVRDGNLFNFVQADAMNSGGNAREQMVREYLRQQAAAGGNALDRRPLFDRMQRGRQGLGPRRPGEMMSSMVQNAMKNDRVDMVNATYRSVYLPILRDELPRSLEVFDFAEPSMVVGSRETANTANQALFMLNNDFVVLRSEAFAQRLIEEVNSPEGRVRRAFELAYGRQPRRDEVAAIRKFVDEFSRQTASSDRGLDTLAAICQSLFAAAEFRYID